jgi:hypothetical protein
LPQTFPSSYRSDRSEQLPDNDMQTGHFYSPRALEERQRKYSDAKHMRLINLIL